MTEELTKYKSKMHLQWLGKVLLKGLHMLQLGITKKKIYYQVCFLCIRYMFWYECGSYTAVLKTHLQKVHLSTVRNACWRAKTPFLYKTECRIREIQVVAGFSSTPPPRPCCLPDSVSSEKPGSWSYVENHGNKTYF